MEVFKGAARLPDRVAVYVPSTVDVDGDGRYLADRKTKETAEALSALFGGCTITEASGCWMSDKAGLVTEAVKIIYANAAPGEIAKHADDILQIARSIKTDMKQEAVSIELNSVLYLV